MLDYNLVTAVQIVLLTQADEYIGNTQAYNNIEFSKIAL